MKWVPILDDLNDYRLKVTWLKPGQYQVRIGGSDGAKYSDADLAAGVHLASAVLTTGPIADQIKAVWAAIKDKNAYYHERIFCGVVRADVKIPDWLDVKLDNIEAKRVAALRDRLSKLPDYFAAIRKASVMHPHQVEIVPSVVKP